jgi:hypothetical protein
MLDLHPLSLITICIGFIIAYGLLQAVESFRRRRRQRAAAKSSQQSDPPDPQEIPPMK